MSCVARFESHFDPLWNIFHRKYYHLLYLGKGRSEFKTGNLGETMKTGSKRPFMTLWRWIKVILLISYESFLRIFKVDQSNFLDWPNTRLSQDASPTCPTLSKNLILDILLSHNLWISEMDPPMSVDKIYTSAPFHKLGNRCPASCSQCSVESEINIFAALIM